MKKLIVAILGLLVTAGVLGGCYSKNCDVACPSSKAMSAK